MKHHPFHYGNKLVIFFFIKFGNDNFHDEYIILTKFYQNVKYEENHATDENVHIYIYIYIILFFLAFTSKLNYLVKFHGDSCSVLFFLAKYVHMQ